MTAERSTKAAEPNPRGVAPGEGARTTNVDGESATAVYGRVRGYFRRERDRHGDYQRHLRRARIPETYDAYLATWVTRGVGAGAIAFSLVLVTVAARMVVGSGPTTIGFVVGSLGAIGCGLVVGAAVFGFGYASPPLTARRRGNQVDILLPHGVTYLYALSSGGVGIVDAIRALAGTEDTHGELAVEFDAITREIDYFGRDPMGALRSRRDETPSEELSRFLDDLDGVLETGGDVTTFLEEETDRTLDRARSRQESFLDTLATLQELYVGAFVVGPLFLILVLLIISLVGGETLPLLSLVIYLVMPVATAGFLWYVRATSADLSDVGRLRRSKVPDTSSGGDRATPADDGRLAEYRRRSRWDRLRGRFQDPVATVRAAPHLALAGSIPAALLLLATVALTGTVTLSGTAMREAPVYTTSVAGLLPALVVVTPVAIFHELGSRRALTIRRRFPEFLSGLSNANRSGLDVADALELVARRGTGPLAAELRLVANDVQWAVDVRQALESLRYRLGQRSIGRTLRLLGDAVGASGDVHRVLDVASRDATVAERLDRARRDETSTYTVITTISFVIYLGIVVVIDRAFIAEFAAIAETLPTETPVGPVQFTRVPTETYRMLLFHAALIQAVANGLVAGRIADESLLSGLKYAIAMVLVTVGAFLLLSPAPVAEVIP